MGYDDDFGYNYYYALRDGVCNNDAEGIKRYKKLAKESDAIVNKQQAFDEQLALPRLDKHGRPKNKLSA